MRYCAARRDFIPLRVASRKSAKPGDSRCSRCRLVTDTGCERFIRGHATCYLWTNLGIRANPREREPVTWARGSYQPGVRADNTPLSRSLIKERLCAPVDWPVALSRPREMVCFANKVSRRRVPNSNCRLQR